MVRSARALEDSSYFQTIFARKISSLRNNTTFEPKQVFSFHILMLRNLGSWILYIIKQKTKRAQRFNADCKCFYCGLYSIGMVLPLIMLESLVVLGFALHKIAIHTVSSYFLQYFSESLLTHI